MSEPAKRVESFEDIDKSMVCYFKQANYWHIYLPNCGIGGIWKHSIEEHEDGTISVTPSILLTGEWGERHGFLTRGVWKEC